MQSSTLSGISPSFTSHSSSNLVDVAARVIEEFRHENGDDYDDIFNFNDFDYNNTANEKSDTNTPPGKPNHENDCDDNEFEFSVVCTDVNSSSISADKIFTQGQIWPQYPLFDTSLLLDVDPNLIQVVNRSPETDCKPALVVRLPLRKLFSEERDFSECFSSEAEELDGVTPGTYCVWKPKPESPKKSNSSRRWKFRDILHRSNSDVTETPFLKKVEKSGKVAAAVGDGASAEENSNPLNKAENRGSRRRSYLPSGQALVGAFANVMLSDSFPARALSSEIRTSGGVDDVVLVVCGGEGLLGIMEQ